MGGWKVGRLVLTYSGPTGGWWTEADEDGMYLGYKTEFLRIWFRRGGRRRNPGTLDFWLSGFPLPRCWCHSWRWGFGVKETEGENLHSVLKVLEASTGSRILLRGIK